MECGLSQAEVGRRAGLPQMHISSIETGKVTPRIDTLLDVIHVLDQDLVIFPRTLAPAVKAFIRDHLEDDDGDSDGAMRQPDGNDRQGTVLASIGRVLNRHPSSSETTAPVEEVDAEALLARLTERERDVFAHLVVGRSNKEIALELEISPRTVEVHRSRVMEKMGARSLPQLLLIALGLHGQAFGDGWKQHPTD